MNYIKISGLKILLLLLSLSSVCFGEDGEVNEFSNLRVALATCNIAKFKSSYSESNISDEQKFELVKMATDIIELEKKNWPKPMMGKGVGYWGDITKIKGRDLKKQIKATYALLMLVVIGGSVVSGCFAVLHIDPLIVGIRNALTSLRILQNGNFLIPATSNAAAEAQNLVHQRNWFLFKLVPKFALLATGALTLWFMTGYSVVEFPQILVSYKRFKGTTKINQLLEAV